MSNVPGELTAEQRYSAALLRLEAIDGELGDEIGSAVAELLEGQEASVLRRLVIAVRQDDYPGLGEAISTARCESYEIDACEHRYMAGRVRSMREEGRTADAGCLEWLMRAAVERELGHQEAAAECDAQAWAARQ